MVITMAKLRMAHASMHGARKSPGPKLNLINATAWEVAFLLLNTHKHGWDVKFVEQVRAMKRFCDMSRKVLLPPYYLT